MAVYLRQATLPEAEKDKLRLFLGLLLTTMEVEEPWEKELRAAPEALAIRFEGEGTAVRSLGDARDDNTPVPEDDLWSRAEQSRAEQSRAEQSRAPAPATPATAFSQTGETATSSDTADAAPPSPQGEGKKPVDPLAGEGASEETAEGSSADAPGEEPGVKDPLVYDVLERMEQEKLSRAKVAEAVGVSELTVGNFLKGKKVYKATRQFFADWMEPWLLAKEILG